MVASIDENRAQAWLSSNPRKKFLLPWISIPRLRALYGHFSRRIIWDNLLFHYPYQLVDLSITINADGD